MDEVLRTLERSVADEVQRLRFAAALDRAGRADDVFDALASARSDPAVRAFLANLPAWTHPWGGDAGKTRWLAARPVRRAPRLRWKANTQRGYGLIATAFGVVVQESAHPWRGELVGTRPRLLCLDPDTGDRRWQVELDGETGPDVHGVARGDVLVVASNVSRPSFVCDLTTGEPCFDLPPGRVALVDRDLIVLSDRLNGARALHWPDPRVPPHGRPRWQAEHLRWLRAGGGVVLGHTDHCTRALARGTGEVLWEVPAGSARREPCVDDDGAFLTSVAPRQEGHVLQQERRLRVLDRSGALRLDVPDDGADLLAPDRYVHAGTGGRADGEVVTIHERRSGRVVAEVTTTGWLYGRRPMAAARDVLYLQSELRREEPWSVTLAGLSFEGQELWRSALDVRDSLSEIAAYPGRIYVLAGDGTVLCLEG